ncbi:MAG TPA: hydroxymethylbilane synthase [Chitinophagaceae bacterium]|nr:hydroxymethylbilane synthase [Chitinophagaceae bacterium]
MEKVIRIGTRESQLAVWQAAQVKELLAQYGYLSELVYIKSEGDIDLKTPLYEMGVQGVFTRSLDSALLNDKIDIAVHSMKDVPTQLAKGIVQAAVLKRASYKDVLVPHPDLHDVNKIFGMGMIEVEDILITKEGPKTKEAITTKKINTGKKVDAIIATSSIRRKSQWLKRFPHHTIEILRGNVNTRLRKLKESNWHGAIFAAAGLERINLLPENSIELDWMLPAPAQGAIMVVGREGDDFCLNACTHFNDADTALCTKIERDFLRTLLGGCSTPISALAEVVNNEIVFKGNILSLDGKDKLEIGLTCSSYQAGELGVKAANELLNNGGREIADSIRNAAK